MLKTLLSTWYMDALCPISFIDQFARCSTKNNADRKCRILIRKVESNYTTNI